MEQLSSRLKILPLILVTLRTLSLAKLIILKATLKYFKTNRIILDIVYRRLVIHPAGKFTVSTNIVQTATQIDGTLNGPNCEQK
jgi:hypothetical protein